MSIMNIQEIKWNGLDALSLESNLYYALLIPSVGANLIQLRQKELGVEILRTPTAEEIETFASRPQIFGLPLLFPPNRIEDGKYTFQSKSYEYPITLPAQNNYHHGIIKSEAFTVTKTEINADHVTVEATYISDSSHGLIYENFPHEFECKMIFILSDKGLTHTVSFKNLSKEEMPLGVGYHTPIMVPFQNNGDASKYKLQLSAGKRWELSERGLPTGKLLDLTAEEALLRTEGILPTGKSIEWALTDEAIVVDGMPYHGAIMTDTNTGIKVFYEVDENFKHWTFWNNGGEVNWACPEPQTWAINAPNLNLPKEVTGFQSVKSGDTWSGTTQLYVK